MVELKIVGGREACFMVRESLLALFELRDFWIWGSIKQRVVVET